MSGVTIQAGSTNLGSIGSSASKATGSPAEQAYREAVKALGEAQEKLTGDLANRADEDTIKLDKLAVQEAAAAVAAAAAAVAQEKKQAQEQRAKAGDRRTEDTGAQPGNAAVLASLVADGSTVDLYT